jgi:hypothetical protein
MVFVVGVYVFNFGFVVAHRGQRAEQMLASRENF